MKKRNVISIVFLLLICFCITSNANEKYSTQITNAIFNYSNESDQNYFIWSKPINSFLYEDTDGSLKRVEYNLNNEIVIESISNYTATQIKTITMSLPIFGGFYNGENYNFIILGQENWNEDNTIPIYRIEKYSKDWNLLDKVDLADCNTVIPFYAGSCRMHEKDSKLFISSSHLMYTSDDGNRHQSNVEIEVDIDTMEITYERTKTMYMYTGYVSHSFNQFIKVENGIVYTVDHGDAYSRGVCLIRKKVGKEFSDEEKQVMAFAGEIGDNTTGATIGGFELSENNCIIVRKFSRSNIK